MSPSPPLLSSPLNSFVVWFGVALSWAVLGRALLALFCFCVFSERGGRFPVEPWTRLHCSELYWRCPVVLPAVQSGAPECSKACPHGSLCGYSVMPWQWPTRWERVASSGIHSQHTVHLVLSAGLAGTMTPSDSCLRPSADAVNHFNLHSLGERV